MVGLASGLDQRGRGGRTLCHDPRAAAATTSPLPRGRHVPRRTRVSGAHPPSAPHTGEAGACDGCPR